MSDDELIDELIRTYEKAKRNEATVQIHLFAIKHANEIKRSKMKISELVKEAGLAQGYAAEISKGIKLSPYVKEREE